MCKIYFHLHALVYIIHTMSGLPQSFEVGSLIIREGSWFYSLFLKNQTSWSVVATESG